MKIKQLYFVLATVLLINSCGNKEFYGKSFDAKPAIPYLQALDDFISKGISKNTLTGKISQVCQSEGCWFMYGTDSTELFVDFNHKFDIPMNVAGKTAVAFGNFYRDTTTVTQLKEYAKDRGKSESFIDSIAAPKIRVVFEASGVKILP